MDESKKCFNEAQQLVDARQEFDSWWQIWSEYIMPRKARITQSDSGPMLDTSNKIYDLTAVHANQILANGQMSHITPIGDPWFSYVPQDSGATENERKYFNECTEVVFRALAGSNFYTEMHEVYLNRSGLGTACLSVMPDDERVLNFRSIPVGSFAVADDEKGDVNAVVREFEATYNQLIGMFGEDNLPESLKDLKDKPEAFTKKHEVWHFVKQNPDYNPEDGFSFKYLSYYYFKETKDMLEKAGFRDFPYMVTRFLKWGESTYGWCPTWLAFPSIVQLNNMARNADILAELQAFPRLLIPDSLVGHVDVNPNGVTIFSETSPAVPQEWQTSGRYDVYKDRIEDRKQDVKNIYHVNMFQMFADLDKEMTAREVSARERERIEQFSPSFTRFVNDITPMMGRIFAICYNAGLFPEAPEEVLREDKNGVFMPPPTIQLTSRVSMALQQVQNSAFDRTLERAMAVAQISPEALDAFNFSVALSDAARTDGISERWLKSMDEIEAIREQRAMQQQQAQEMAMMQSGSEVVKNVKE